MLSHTGKEQWEPHASQLNKLERWKVAMYVRTLQHGDFNLGGLTGKVEADSTVLPSEGAAVNAG